MTTCAITFCTNPAVGTVLGSPACVEHGALVNQTPVEIDTELARLYGEIAKAEAQSAVAWDGVQTGVKSHLGKGYREMVSHTEVRDTLREVVEEGLGQGYYVDMIRRNFVRYEDAKARVETLLTEVQPLDEEFDRRGGWTRAFLVNNSNGHVHRSQACSTTYPTTQWLWLPEFSDHAESEIVEAAGERACTVCYPSAPVEVLARPTQIFTPDEVEKQRAREEREAKKAAAQAAQVVVEGYLEFGGKQSRAKTFKTVRAVTNDIASHLSSLCWYGVTHPSAVEWLSNIEQARKALAARGEDYDYDKALASARKRVTREGGTPKF